MMFAQRALGPWHGCPIDVGQHTDPQITEPKNARDHDKPVVWRIHQGTFGSLLHREISNATIWTPACVLGSRPCMADPSPGMLRSQIRLSWSLK